MNMKQWCGFAAGMCLFLAVSSQAAPDWVQQTSHTLATLGGISFLDENTGFITGDSGVVLKTRDGGATWTKLSAGSGCSWMSTRSIRISSISRPAKAARS